MAVSIDFQWERAETGYVLVPAGARDPRGQEHLFGPVREYLMGPRITQIAESSRAGESEFDLDGIGPFRNAFYLLRELQEPPLNLGLVRTLPVTKSDLTDQVPDFERIIPRDLRSVPYRPPSGLCWVFATQARTKKGLLDFITQYGALTREGNRQGEDVWVGLSQATIMYMLLKAGTEERTRYLSRWGDFGMPIGPWSVFLGLYPTTGMPQLKYGGKQSLCDFLWLEVAAEIANGSVGQQCEFCGSLFNSGPGTGRRADAKFCSDAHRVAFNRRERKKKEQR